MAFIYRADRDPNIFHISSNVVGPGEYLDKKPKISPRQNKEPFLTSAEKFTNQKNETPGPGTYYQDTQKLNNIKKIEKSNYNYNNDLVFARIKENIVTLPPTEKLGFDSKAKRFIPDGFIKTNSYFYKTPGPGQYFPSIINEAKNANNKNKRFNQNNSKLTFIKSYSTSNMNISQEKIGLASVIIESKNNNSNKKEKNKLRKTFQYDNFACRPKLYNLHKFKEIMQYNNINSNNNKTCNENMNSLYSTNYSDNKNRTRNKQNCRIFDINEEYNMMKNSERKYNNGNSELRKEILDFFKTYNSICKNSMKSRINFCKKRNKKKIDNKSINYFDKLLEAKSPGPGYYFDILCKPIKYSKIQNYFTKEKKFHQLKKPWTQLGPGQYFIASNTRNKSNSNNKDIPFGSIEKRNNTFLCLENTINNPGPGNYEFQPFTKDIEKDEHPLVDVQFGFTGERFNDNYTMRDRYNAPGPGYYISNNDNKINNNKDLKSLIHPSKTREIFNIKKIPNSNENQFLNGKYTSLEEYKFRDNVPPVGYYCPEYFSTIEYKNRINLMNSKNADICFNKSITKSLKKSDSAPNIVGPGYYITNKEKKKNSNNDKKHPPFFSSQEKKSFPEKKQKIIINIRDLNKYHMSDYFQWNKKSFNVIFV